MLNVAGTATLSGGDLYVIGKRSDYVLDAHTNVLVANGGLTGTFSAINAASNVMLTATAGYDATSAVKAAAKLKGRLLLAHGGMDDNVHAQNTMRLVKA